MNINLIRMQEIRQVLVDIGNQDTMTEEDEKKSDALIKEFESLRRKEDISDVDKFMREPLTQPIKPDLGFSSNNQDSVKLYNRSNLNELRSHIRSLDQTGISENEAFSAGKYIRGLITGDWSNAQVERRAVTTGTSGGGYLLPQIVASYIIPMALNKSQCFKAGAVSTPMTDKFLTIPKIVEMPATEWKAESVKYAKSEGMTFDGLLLGAKTLMSLIKISVELAQDSTSVSVEKVIEDAISESIALEIDRVILNGAGTALEPEGILQTEGILVEDLEYGAITSYDFLANAYWKLQAENEVATALIAPSNMFRDLDLLKDATTLNPLKPPVSYTGEGTNRMTYQKLSSNQLVNDAVMGDFGKVLIGFRTDMDISVTDQAEDSFAKLEVWIRAYIRADVGIKREKAFCHIKHYGEIGS